MSFIFVNPCKSASKDMKDPSHRYYISEDIHCRVDNINDSMGVNFVTMLKHSKPHQLALQFDSWQPP